MIRLSIFALFISATLFNTYSVYSQSFECDFREESINAIPVKVPTCISSGLNVDHHIPNNNVYPTCQKILGLIIHVIQDDDGGQNFGIDDEHLLFDYIDETNAILSDLQPSIPQVDCVGTFIEDSQIRLSLEGVKYYQNTDYNCQETLCPITGSDRIDIRNFILESTPNSEKYFHLIIYGHRPGRNCDVATNCLVCTEDQGEDLCPDPVFGSGGIGTPKSNVFEVRGLYSDKNDVNGHANLIAHELGHNLELAHTHMSSCCFLTIQGKSNNIMDSDPKGQFNRYSLSQCQIATMHKTIERYFPSQMTNICEKGEGAISILRGEQIVWNTSEVLKQDLHIFGKLTILCDVVIANEVDIIVHRGGVLDLFGFAHLKGCGDGEWNGITIEGISGDNDNRLGRAGKLISDGQGLFDVFDEVYGVIIEDARKAISMNPKHLGAQNIHGFGGFVQLKNTLIRNCRRGIEFMRHAQNGIEDKSTITNVAFENIHASAVTIWANDGVRFRECTFNNVATGFINPQNIQHEAIRAEQAWLSVDDCIFNESPFGVVLAGTDPLADISGPSSITNSDFSTNFTSIELKTYDIQESSVADGAFNEIDNNKFLSGSRGIFIENESPVKITDNDFANSELGVFIQNGGISYENEVSQNEFMDNIDRGICFDGINNESVFEANCFNGSLISDVDIPSGQVNEDQGDIDLEAGNRYTKSAIPEIRNNGLDIDYFIWEERNPGDREYLDNSTRSSILPSEEENLNDCGAAFAPNPEPDDCASYLASISEIMTLLSGIDDIIVQSDDAEKVEVAISLKEDIFRQLNSFVNNASEQNAELSVNDLKALMSQQVEFTIRTFVPAMSIRAGAYNLAMTELNNLTSDSEAQSDYIETQRIYVDFLQSGREEVSSSQLAFLRTVSQKSDRLSAYARTILYIVSGERAEVIAPFASSELERRVRRDSQNRTIRIYPNPVGKQGLTLLVSEQKAQSYTYELSSFSGHLAFTGTVTSNLVTKMATNGLSAGIYFIIIKDNKNAIIQHQKIVVTN